MVSAYWRAEKTSMFAFPGADMISGANNSAHVLVMMKKKSTYRYPEIQIPHPCLHARS